MKAKAILTAAVALVIVGTLIVAPALAQQTGGAPGSPSATTTIDGRYLPNPLPNFGGEINLNASQSKPWWPPACGTA